MKKNLLHIILLGIAMVAVATMCFAQIKTGTIRGVVKDETNAVLPGVVVELQSEALMGVHTATTDDRGFFRFPALPIGTYEVTFSLEGFQTLNRKDLRVTIGGTISLDITLKIATIEETITVTGESPIVDVAKSSFSSSYDDKFLESLPTRRFTFFDIVQASPGLTPGDIESSRVSAFGSDVKSSAYYLNGTDISAPSTGAAWIWPIPDAIAELEVTGVGAKAEYGNFQGAIINVVSKSGSNTFSGSAKYFFQHNSLTGNNTPDEKWPYHITHWHDFVGSFGGAIKKDKLWFFAAIEHHKERTTGIGADPAYPAKYQIAPMIIARLDYQVNQKNKLTFYAHYNKYHWSTPPTEYQPYETIAGENDWVVSPNAEWLSILSDKTYFEIKYASFFTNLWYDPIDGDMTTPGRYDWGTGYYSGNATYFYHWNTNRVQLNGAVSHFADDFLSGDHDFKFGAQYNRGLSDVVQGYWGGVAYMDWMGEPYVAYFWQPSHIGGINHQFGLFLDDTWTMSDRFTLNLGVRFDYNRGSIPDYDELDINENPTGTVIPGIPDVANWKNVSPRIGFNYQLTSDMKTVLRGSYGRYYDALIIGDFQSATPAQADFSVYQYNPATGAFDIPWYTWNPTAQLGLDANLKTPYADQFSLAVEREIAPNFSLSATFIYKRSLNSIGQLNTVAQYGEIPFLDAYSGNTITVYNQFTPIQNFYLVTNPGDKKTYKALMLVANKRLSDNWQLYSSLTISRSWIIPKGYRDKNELINAEGPPGEYALGYDRTWMFKLGGTYFAPFGILLGTNLIYQEGGAWERTVLVSGLNQGSKFIKAEPRGSRRTPNQIYFDVKVEKDFKLGDRYAAKISIDILNLLNKDTNLYWVSTQAESPNFMVPTGIIMPRRAMVGLMFIF
jgi:hypothetical protein